ncbi:hypothetical protein CAP36_17075 [Chitinophagaceae bacterium IBVUCB2]|nr:hypothetical protein CAP36_17075 [Chitinophagaceae bacterium IBVUCB2]
MSRSILFIPIFLLQLLLFSPNPASGQCGAFTSAQLNWDNLDYYWNSGGNGPYQNYITDAMEQTQRFAIGRNWLSIVTSNSALVAPGSGNSAENALHTGEIANYTGQDVQYNPTANNQTVVITFNQEVLNANFTLYDIDMNASVTVSAVDALGVAQIVAVTTYTSSILTATGITSKNVIDLLGADAAANNSNIGSATFNVPAAKTITITINVIGTDAVFWLSDINACINGSFPTNWHQQANNRPFVGPTQNMPDYFLLTPDNDVAYYIDPISGQARQLFQDAARDYVNSFGYDPYNRYLYYISENNSLDPNNRTVKRYDYNTETTNTTYISNITTSFSLGIPTFNYGIESAGCAFYDGALYFGIEGGKYDPDGGSGTTNDRTRETLVWRIDLDASNNPTVAYQVVAFDHYLNASNTSIHDWGDFLIRNGVLYNFNTARNGSPSVYNESKFHHYDMTTGQMTNVYSNPNTISPANRASWNGQAGMTWAGNLYYFRPSTTAGLSQVGLYNEVGGIGTPTTITVVGGGTAWPGGSGDASDPFRPKCDFGDAPATYDPYVTPATQSPAVHERSENIRLGATWDHEFLKRGVTGTNDVDDGIGTVAFLPPSWNAGYVVQASAFNNSGSPATLIAWLDYNGNGVFDASEAITPITVPSSASAQNFWLYWPYTMNSFTNGQATWLRVRITAQSAGMTTAHPTGYFTNGEVEDYRVPVDNFPLSTRLIDFAAILKNKKVDLKWSAAEETGIYGYEVERSADNINWVKINTVSTNGGNGIKNYQVEDANPVKGISYYRLRIIENTGMKRFSEIKTISYKELAISIAITPNPAIDRIKLNITTSAQTEAVIQITDMQGRLILSTAKNITLGLSETEIILPAGINSGVYMVRIKAGDEVIRQKLIVNK